MQSLIATTVFTSIHSAYFGNRADPVNLAMRSLTMCSKCVKEMLKQLANYLPFDKSNPYHLNAVFTLSFPFFGKMSIDNIFTYFEIISIVIAYFTYIIPCLRER